MAQAVYCPSLTHAERGGARETALPRLCSPGGGSLVPRLPAPTGTHITHRASHCNAIVIIGMHASLQPRAPAPTPHRSRKMETQKSRPADFSCASKHHAAIGACLVSAKQGSARALRTQALDVQAHPRTHRVATVDLMLEPIAEHVAPSRGFGSSREGRGAGHRAVTAYGWRCITSLSGAESSDGQQETVKQLPAWGTLPEEDFCSGWPPFLLNGWRQWGFRAPSSALLLASSSAWP